MPRLVKNNRSLFFVHIPKTGGTSLYANLMRHNVVVEDYNPHKIAFEGVSSHHLNMKQLKEFYPEQTLMHRFCIIREPWKRTLSAYAYRNQKRSFTHFERWLIKNLHAYTTYKPNVLDNHICPMHLFIDKKTKIFLHNKRKPMYNWINKKLKVHSNYSAKKNISQKYEEYPFEMLSKETQTLWHSVYEKDLDIYSNHNKNYQI